MQYNNGSQGKKEGKTPVKTIKSQFRRKDKTPNKKRIVDPFKIKIQQKAQRPRTKSRMKLPKIPKSELDMKRRFMHTDKEKKVHQTVDENKLQKRDKLKTKLKIKRAERSLSQNKNSAEDDSFPSDFRLKKHQNDIFQAEINSKLLNLKKQPFKKMLSLNDTRLKKSKKGLKNFNSERENVIDNKAEAIHLEIKKKKLRRDKNK